MVKRKKKREPTIKYEIEVRNRNSFNSTIKLAKKFGFKCSTRGRDAECYNYRGDSVIVTMVSKVEAEKRGWR